MLPFLLAALVGVSLGLLGGGGSILAVPILVYAAGFEVKESIAMGLAIVGLASVVGAFRHWQSGNVKVKEAGLFAAIAMAGTWGGAKLAAFLSGALQLAIFSLVMLAAAVFLLRGRGDAAPRRAGLLPIAASAIAVGLLTGIAGVGGGFLIVPALVLFVGLPMKQAVGTSLLVIAVNSFVGFAGYLGMVAIPWGFLGLFSAVAVAGIVAGTAASPHVSQTSLQRAFAIFLIVVALFLLIENRETFLSWL